MSNASNLDSIHDQIIELISDVSGIPSNELDPNASPADLGIDSRLTFEILARVSRTFSLNVRIESVVGHMKTVGAVVNSLREQIVARNVPVSSRAATRKTPTQVVDERSIPQPESVVQSVESTELTEIGNELLPSAESLRLKLSTGLNWECIKVGQGPPLLLLSPLYANALIWTPVVANLKAERTLYIPNYPGYGRSDYSNGSISPSELAEQIRSVCIELAGSKPVDVVGWSLGGMVAQCLAKQYPDFVRKVVLVSTAACLGVESSAHAARELLDKLADDLREKSPAGAVARREYERLAVASRGSTDFDIRLQYAMEVAKFDNRQHLSTSECDTLILGGAEDSVTPPELMRFLAAEIPHAKSHLVSGTGHLFPLQYPNRFCSLVRKHLGMPRRWPAHAQDRWRLHTKFDLSVRSREIDLAEAVEAPELDIEQAAINESSVAELLRQLSEDDITYREGLIERNGDALATGINSKLGVLIQATPDPLLNRAFDSHRRGLVKLCSSSASQSYEEIMSTFMHQVLPEFARFAAGLLVHFSRIPCLYVEDVDPQHVAQLEIKMWACLLDANAPDPIVAASISDFLAALYDSDDPKQLFQANGQVKSVVIRMMRQQHQREGRLRRTQTLGELLRSENTLLVEAIQHETNRGAKR
ncbi:MAG: alpha/beta fold hydrolase [Planctomycetota bacterium]